MELDDWIVSPDFSYACWVCQKIQDGLSAFLWPQSMYRDPVIEVINSDEDIRVEDSVKVVSIQEKLAAKGVFYWKVWIDSHNEERFRSRHKNIETCYQHGLSLYAEWIWIASSEVDFAKACDAYYERTER